MSVYKYVKPLQRSQSLPHIMLKTSMDTAFSESCSILSNEKCMPRHCYNDNVCRHPYHPRIVDELKQLMTIRQHYYPESGWGWLILLIGVIVQCVTFGLHTSCSVISIEISRFFRLPYELSGIVFYYIREKTNIFYY